MPLRKNEILDIRKKAVQAVMPLMSAQPRIMALCEEDMDLLSSHAKDLLDTVEWKIQQYEAVIEACNELVGYGFDPDVCDGEVQVL